MGTKPWPGKKISFIFSLNMKYAILYCEQLKEYDFGGKHPFDGRRFKIFINYWKKKIPNKIYQILKANPIEDYDLNLICDKDYIEFNREFFKEKSRGREINGDFFKYHSLDNFPQKGCGNLEMGARYILGQAKLAADLVMGGKFEKVVSIGGGLHHAKRNFGEGFCIYNDVAFLGKYLLEKYRLKKILILDTDAHAGNGTYEYFARDARILFIDLHQDPKTIYPQTGFLEEIGEKEGKGFKINIPLPTNAGDFCYQIVFEEIVEPIVKKFKPEIIIRNGGSDPHFSDYLTNLGLTLKGFKILGEKVRKLAQVADGKEIDLIASGYNLEVLPRAWCCLISALFDFNIQEKIEEKFDQEPIEKTKEIIKKIKQILRPFWGNFKT